MWFNNIASYKGFGDFFVWRGKDSIMFVIASCSSLVLGFFLYIRVQLQIVSISQYIYINVTYCNFIYIFQLRLQSHYKDTTQSYDSHTYTYVHVYFWITIPQSSCNLTIGPHQIYDKFISNIWHLI
jgi:hypothetical protein